MTEAERTQALLAGYLVLLLVLQLDTLGAWLGEYEAREARR